MLTNIDDVHSSFAGSNLVGTNLMIVQNKQNN